MSNKTSKWWRSVRKTSRAQMLKDKPKRSAIASSKANRRFQGNDGKDYEFGFSGGVRYKAKNGKWRHAKKKATRNAG